MLSQAGIAVSLLVPPGPHTGSLAWAELHGDRATLHEDTSWLTGEVSTYRDYSRVTPAHPALYLLPHLWAGVIPRMLDGYRLVFFNCDINRYKVSPLVVQIFSIFICINVRIVHRNIL